MCLRVSLYASFLQQVKRNIAILSLPALTPNGVDSDVLQQVKRNIAILSLPALTPNGVDRDILQQVN